MSKLHGAHPTPEQLVAFGLGLSDPDERQWVEEHIGACESCCQALEAVPDDTLVGRIRSCDTSVFDATASPHGMDTESTNAIPPELLEHPRYRIVRQLGRGGMGVVYQAEHRLMQRTVAVKVINRRLLRSDKAVQRFNREVRNAARLAHPQIVMAYDAEQAGAIHLLVMEYVEGVNLAEHVAANGPLPVTVACDYIRQSALGLQYASERGMVHRDIKPQNLMLTPAGQIKILDFGLARFASEAEDDSRRANSTLTAGGAMLGTPDYAAPEQILDARTADTRADIYSLGCTLYFLLTGSPPFPAGTAVQKMTNHLQHQPPTLRGRSGIPEGFVRLVDQLLAKSPADRIQTPAEVAAALLPFTGQLPEPAVQPPPLSPIQIDTGATRAETRVAASGTGPERRAARVGKSTRRRTQVLLAVGGGGLLALCALVVYWLFGPPGGETLPVTAPPRVLMVLPYRNFWGPDYVEVGNRLRKAGVLVEVASSKPGAATASREQTTAEYEPVPVNVLLSEASPDRYEAVVFAGALPYADLEFVHDKQEASVAGRFARQMLAQGKYVASICVGTAVLAESGLLNDRDAAWSDYLPADVAPLARITKFDDRPLCRAGKIITTRNYQDAPVLAKELRRVLNVSSAP